MTPGQGRRLSRPSAGRRRLGRGRGLPTHVPRLNPVRRRELIQDRGAGWRGQQRDQPCSFPDIRKILERGCHMEKEDFVLRGILEREQSNGEWYDDWHAEAVDKLCQEWNV